MIVSGETLRAETDAIADMWDGGWEDFNVCMNGLPGLGGTDRTTYLIHGYDGNTQVRIILNGDPSPASTKRFQFDPRFEEFKIEGTTGIPNNNAHYTWDFDANGYPNNVEVNPFWFCDLELDGTQAINPAATGGYVIRRAYTWDDFLNFWGTDEDAIAQDGSFLYELEQTIGD